ncbi:hypothetical protein [Streptomyces longhuiensis]|uniref:hypothetical protein n=1 Tax=Streptomyces longhuiensis TaxID=2880933 RepID=UPI001D0A6463|nr:hypothetical protein [Streptomyces longhuiensis]UDL98166.1 hypothetical protein LGI35_07845 [Streptomyces longhuiensis]
MSPTRFASQHRWIYVCAILLLLALVVVGVIQYDSVRTTDDAHKKAQQLADELVAAGYSRPDTGGVVRTLGTDGGNACDDPGSALKSGLWKIHLSNGAGGPGQRPVISDRRAVEAEAIILGVYCPDKLEKIKDKVDDLRTDDTVRR